ncbi:MAG: hypothetical protein V4613_14850 [Bacteroidota bacterium]
MKKFQFKYILPLFISYTLLSTACKDKHEHDEVKPEAAIITITTPYDAQEFEVGDTVKINAAISAPANLHGYEMHLTRLADTTTIIDTANHAHAMNYSIYNSLVNDGKIHSDYRLEIIAIVDHAGTKVSKVINFHCHAH